MPANRDHRRNPARDHLVDRGLSSESWPSVLLFRPLFLEGTVEQQPQPLEDTDQKACSHHLVLIEIALERSGLHPAPCCCRDIKEGGRLCVAQGPRLSDAHQGFDDRRYPLRIVQGSYRLRLGGLLNSYIHNEYLMIYSYRSYDKVAVTIFQPYATG